MKNQIYLLDTPIWAAYVWLIGCTGAFLHGQNAWSMLVTDSMLGKHYKFITLPGVQAHTANIQAALFRYITWDWWNHHAAMSETWRDMTQSYVLAAVISSRQSCTCQWHHSATTWTRRVCESPSCPSCSVELRPPGWFGDVGHAPNDG